MIQKSVLVLGAGRSSSALISYMLTHSAECGWHVTVGDYEVAAARERIGDSKNGTAIHFDITDFDKSKKAIETADVVLSLLPASFHPQVARLCLMLKKHLITASYVSDEMQSFHAEARTKDLLFLNECGLDPGVDHMSAMKVIDDIRERGGKLYSFESFTGGLIAPETDPENPWRYKFTWNPRNVVIAGQGTAKFIQEGQYKFIPYQQLFQRITNVQISGYGNFEGYANRDSLKYIETYGLSGIPTMLRGTLRNAGFCSAWNVFVQLGCADDTYPMEHVSEMTHRDFINSFLPYDEAESVEEKLASRLDIQADGPEMKRLKWLNLFSSEKIGLPKGTPAQILEHILNKKWKLNAADKDMVVMWHRFRYKLEGKNHEIQASLITKGDDAVNTAMAKGVGLPMAIAAKLLLQEKIQQRGVVIPIEKEIYRPVLQELELLDIHVKEEEKFI